MDVSQLASKNSLRLLGETVAENVLKGGNCSCSYLARSMSRTQKSNGRQRKTSKETEREREKKEGNLGWGEAVLRGWDRGFGRRCGGAGGTDMVLDAIGDEGRRGRGSLTSWQEHKGRGRHPRANGKKGRGKRTESGQDRAMGGRERRDAQRRRIAGWRGAWKPR